MMQKQLALCALLVDFIGQLSSSPIEVKSCLEKQHEKLVVHGRRLCSETETAVRAACNNKCPETTSKLTSIVVATCNNLEYSVDDCVHNTAVHNTVLNTQLRECIQYALASNIYSASEEFMKLMIQATLPEETQNQMTTLIDDAISALRKSPSVINAHLSKCFS